MTLLKMKEVIRILKDAGYKIERTKKHVIIKGPHLDTGEIVVATLRHPGGKTGAEIPEHIVSQIRSELGIDLRHAKGIKFRVVKINEQARKEYLGINAVPNSIKGEEKMKELIDKTPDGKRMIRLKDEWTEMLVSIGEYLYKGSMYDSLHSNLEKEWKEKIKKLEEAVLEKDIKIEELEQEIKNLSKVEEKTKIREKLKKRFIKPKGQYSHEEKREILVKIQRGIELSQREAEYLILRKITLEQAKNMSFDKFRKKEGRGRFTDQEKKDIYYSIQNGIPLDSRQKNYLRLRRLTIEEVENMTSKEFEAVKCIAWSKWSEEKETEKPTKIRKIKKFTEDDKRNLFEKIKMGEYLLEHEKKYLQNRGLKPTMAKNLTWQEFLDTPTLWTVKYSKSTKTKPRADTENNRQ